MPLFSNMFNKFNKYKSTHIKFYLDNSGVKVLGFWHYDAKLLWTLIHNVTRKYVTHPRGNNLRNTLVSKHVDLRNLLFTR